MVIKNFETNWPKCDSSRSTDCWEYESPPFSSIDSKTGKKYCKCPREKWCLQEYNNDKAIDDPSYQPCQAPTDGENPPKGWNSATNKCKSTYSIGLDQIGGNCYNNEHYQCIQGIFAVGSYNHSPVGSHGYAKTKKNKIFPEYESNQLFNPHSYYFSLKKPNGYPNTVDLDNNLHNLDGKALFFKNKRCNEDEGERTQVANIDFESVYKNNRYPNRHYGVGPYYICEQDDSSKFKSLYEDPNVAKFKENCGSDEKNLANLFNKKLCQSKEQICKNSCPDGWLREEDTVGYNDNFVLGRYVDIYQKDDWLNIDYLGIFDNKNNELQKGKTAKFYIISDPNAIISDPNANYSLTNQNDGNYNSSRYVLNDDNSHAHSNNNSGNNILRVDLEKKKIYKIILKNRSVCGERGHVCLDRIYKGGKLIILDEAESIVFSENITETTHPDLKNQSKDYKHIFNKLKKTKCKPPPEWNINIANSVLG